jgi:predicted ATPase
MPAVRLFAQRGRAADGYFVVDAGNIAEVAATCRALDGIPLAIELAAARVGVMPISEISRHLDDRFRRLGGGRRAQPRHRTLLATVW